METERKLGQSRRLMDAREAFTRLGKGQVVGRYGWSYGLVMQGLNIVWARPTGDPWSPCIADILAGDWIEWPDEGNPCDKQVRATHGLTTHYAAQIRLTDELKEIIREKAEKPPDAEIGVVRKEVKGEREARQAWDQTLDEAWRELPFLCRYEPPDDGNIHNIVEDLLVRASSDREAAIRYAERTWERAGYPDDMYVKVMLGSCRWLYQVITRSSVYFEPQLEVARVVGASLTPPGIIPDPRPRTRDAATKDKD